MRVAYVTHYDAREVRHYSGTAYFIARELEAQNVDVVRIGGLEERFKRLLQLRQLAYRKLLGTDHHRTWEPLSLDGWARQVEAQLATCTADLILSPSTIPLANLRTRLPIVLWSDATFAALEDFYPDYSNISSRMRAHGHAADQRVIDKARLLIYSSDWAAQSAQHRYGADAKSIHVVPYGANLHDPPSTETVHSAIDARQAEGEVRLLWVGRGWDLKGASVAIETLRRLRESGRRASLTLVGSDAPRSEAIPDGVTVIPFLDKEKPEQRDRLRALFLSAHFFLLPTQADCTPIVFSEAAACGVPVVTYAIGGIPSIVVQGESGILLSPGNLDFAAHIEKALKPGAYEPLARGARSRYETTLNWTSAVRSVRGLLDSVLQSASADGR